MVHAIIHTITLNTSGTAGKCIEGREFIIALPESFVEYKADDVVRLFTDSVHKRYDVECSAALHHNKKMTNYHIHLVFSERKMLEHPEVKIATRNMFYDEQGKHRRTKKEILDEQGNLRAGCSIIPKGEVYESHIFTKKDEWFKNDAFTREIKEMFTEIINSHVKEESEKLSVFQQGGVYLATKKIGKNNPREAEIRADNAVRQEWNRMVDAIGIVSKSGRYGGTYAHTDIAFEFASWISPEFKLYIIKDYQRLKKDEADRLAIGWDVKRELSKINYCIHTDAVKEFLITPTLSPQEMAYTYASEADILNMALFGKTAAQWRTEKGIKGKTPNIRDFASAEELIVLINLEDTNADLIRQEVPKIERLKILREKAYRQLELLRKNQDTIAALKKNLIEDTETNG